MCHWASWQYVQTWDKRVEQHRHVTGIDLIQQEKLVMPSLREYGFQSCSIIPANFAGRVGWISLHYPPCLTSIDLTRPIPAHMKTSPNMCSSFSQISQQFTIPINYPVRTHLHLCEPISVRAQPKL